ncbi:phospho-N-acetylmuramoyl-pentapeptide-transferase [Streptomyces olivaceus]|jgi:phospho-N-acetylmuramoyl-pentapeptide-transferase|nr:phospho-N-acetylmuramoyl-pentapeptide-transferase [Streptomyces olivaceus]
MMKQILFAGVIGLFLTLVGTPLLIKLLARKGYGQYIRDDGPREHASKRGTPTMGGIAFIFATVAAYFLAKVITSYLEPDPNVDAGPTFSGLLVLGLMVGMGLVGFLDDYIKIVKRRSLGLRAKAKMAGQLIVGIAFAVLALQFADNRGNTPASTKLSFITDFGWTIGPVLFVIWALFMILAMSNGVNLTDGLDGLATGASVLVFGAYTFIGVWQFQESCANAQTLTNPGACYEVRDPLDLAVVASALMGACLGFLWWNTSPAKIFMGDTGSLALGGVLAGLAICSRTELLMAILGGLFVLITMSVVIQVGSFRLTGKRVFRMAPLQHHFELKGWSEVLVVVRFWIIQGICVIVGLGLFYAGWAADK